jgi:uncharacterized protein (TIRG00374 family)
MDQLFRAIDTFLEELSSIAWGALALALLCQLAKVGARTRSWRNIIAASYPEAEVRWRTVFGAYAAGVGVNAVLPVRGGDVLKLYLVKHRVAGATYPTLAATLVVDTLFDFVVASCLLVWAVREGLLPGFDVLPRLPAIDWLWLFRSPFTAALALGTALVVGFAAGLWASHRIESFRQRVSQGFAIFRPPRRYAVHVVPWQALDWCFRLATVYFFLVAFGLNADLYNALAVQVTQGLSTALPLTPAGIGTEQALLVYVFSGTASAKAVLSFSVGMKIVLISFNVVLGFAAILLMLGTVRWRRVVERDPDVSNGRVSTP